MESTPFKTMHELVGENVLKVNDDKIETLEFNQIFEENKDTVKFYLLYFGAHWAPPCRLFIRNLTKFNENLNKD